jgi:lysophospholipid acyltransferase
MMVLVMKLSSYAWSVYDASLPIDKLSEDQKTYAVREKPSIVAFMGYCLFFCGVWVGPAFEYQTYHQFIHQQVCQLT